MNTHTRVGYDPKVVVVDEAGTPPRWRHTADTGSCNENAPTWQ